MPYAVAHFLTGIVLVDLFRDYFIKNKKKFPLHYVLVGGLGGVLPDLDVLLFYILSFFGTEYHDIHRTFTHTLLFVGIFIFLGVLTFHLKEKKLRKHHLKLSTIFFVLAFGILTHVILDALLVGEIMPLYPFSTQLVGLNLVARIVPASWLGSFFNSLDAALLIIWICYLELKHKVSDFI